MNDNIIQAIVASRAGESGMSATELEKCLWEGFGIDVVDDATERHLDFRDDPTRPEPKPEPSVQQVLDQLTANGSLLRVRRVDAEARYTDPRVRRYRTKREQAILQAVGSHGSLTPAKISALVPMSFTDAKIATTLLQNQGELHTKDRPDLYGYQSFTLTGVGAGAVRGLR